MKIAISAAGQSLDADAEPRFGRCPYFIIVDPETLEFEAVDNSAAMAAGGAGISAAQAIANKGVEAVLTGNCGPNAYQVLAAAGIQVITGISGKVKDAAESYRSGKFKASNTANVPDHFGMGRGCGKGRGMGMGMGAGFGMASTAGPAPQQQSPEAQLGNLKAKSQAMMQELAEIQRQIEKLQNKE
jgi:predicted Fe-Mo cluster-binding NifX family protein